jgi:hypothetical protein
MSMHIVDDEQRSDRRPTPMRPLGSGLEGASALLALLDDVHRHRLRRAALHLPLPSQERGPFQFSDRLLASLLFARAALSSFPFLLQTVLNRPQRYSDKDGRKTGFPDLPGVCPENYSDVILQRTGVTKATFRFQECVNSVGLRWSNMPRSSRGSNGPCNHAVSRGKILFQGSFVDFDQLLNQIAASLESAMR